MEMAFAAVLLGVTLPICAAEYSWQQPHAKVIPSGDLEWAPRPYRLAVEPGATFRYLDFERGDDRQDGKTPETAWKHHPLDPQATGAARNGLGAYTYLFKGGVEYRGTLRGRLEGTAEQPIRLAWDPNWGAVPPVLLGSESVSGWIRGADRPDIPEGDKVWRANLSFAPRRVWVVDASGQIERLRLARTPNWRISDPDDVMSEWWTWEQPEWWKGHHKTTLDGRRMHLGIDRQHLTGRPEDYIGGIVWSEWGIVMGTPFASRIEAFDADRRAMAFQGFWYNDSGTIITGNRYFLEDRPNFLDEPGEFWFERKGEGGTLYVRLPADRDPREARVEAARHINLMDLDSARHVRIEGLVFRFNNVFWDLTARGFVHRDVEGAAIRLLGSGEDVQIRHCRFEHVQKAIRMKLLADDQRLDRVVVADNDIQFTDHGAIEISDSSRWGKQDPPFGELLDVRVLRNRLYEIGHRPFRSDSAHALVVEFPETLEVAGNVIERCYGAGIWVFGGKGSEQTRDRPLCRLLIHHNKVTHSLLAANDWGGIETWQGGPAYVYNNISGNANGYWNWAYRPEKPASARLGFAYYLDGAFKNYYFNNIAWGVSNDLTSRRCSHTAFYQATPTLLNLFANNTAYNFADGSAWSPAGGRQLYLGNLWLHISRHVFHHGKQKEDADAHYDKHPLETIGYGGNVFYEVHPLLAVLDGAGSRPMDLAELRAVAQRHGMLASDIGDIAQTSPVYHAAAHDFRPVPGGAAIGKGAKIFVPWGLARVVGEWHFYRNPADPAVVRDEHWYMSPRLVDRNRYRLFPRYDLQGIGIGLEDYVVGPLEDWTAGALRLNGTHQYLVLPHPRSAPDNAARITDRAADWVEVERPAAVAPRETFEIQVRLPARPRDTKLIAHLHWLKKDGWGGFNALGDPSHVEVQGEGPYRFRFRPEPHEGLTAWSLLLALTPTGDWNDRTAQVTVTIPLGDPPTPSPQEMPNPHDVDRRFLVEAVFRAAQGGGTLVRDFDTRGYSLDLTEDGQVRFRVRADREAEVRSSQRVADGQWHHIIAEADLDAGVLRLYVDGKKDIEAPARLAGGCRNEADLVVGQGFAGELDFLRICLGTLDDAKTTIEELYAWQFDGPFLKDFTGARPSGRRRDAGAIQGR